LRRGSIAAYAFGEPMLPTRRHLLRSLADHAYDGTEHPAYTTSVYAVDRPGLPHPASVV